MSRNNCAIAAKVYFVKLWCLLASGCLIAVYSNSPYQDTTGSIFEERRIRKLHSSKTFISGYLQETTLSSDSLVIVELMFVYS